MLQTYYSSKANHAGRNKIVQLALNLGRNTTQASETSIAAYTFGPNLVHHILYFIYIFTEISQATAHAEEEIQKHQDIGKKEDNKQ